MSGDGLASFPFVQQSSNGSWFVTNEAKTRLEKIRGTKVRCISIVGKWNFKSIFTHSKLVEILPYYFKANIELGSRICWENFREEMGLL